MKYILKYLFFSLSVEYAYSGQAFFYFFVLLSSEITVVDVQNTLPLYFLYRFYKLFEIKRIVVDIHVS